VENRDTAQCATTPLNEVLVEVRMECLDEGTHEGDFESWSRNRALPPLVHTLVVGDQDQNSSKDDLPTGPSTEEGG
jgi:hypothetical protein